MQQHRTLNTQPIKHSTLYSTQLVTTQEQAIANMHKGSNDSTHGRLIRSGQQMGSTMGTLCMDLSYCHGQPIHLANGHIELALILNKPAGDESPALDLGSESLHNQTHQSQARFISRFTANPCEAQVLPAPSTVVRWSGMIVSTSSFEVLCG